MPSLPSTDLTTFELTATGPVVSGTVIYCQAIVLQAHPDNADVVEVRSTATPTVEGPVLPAGDKLELPVSDPSRVHLVIQAGDKVRVELRYRPSIR